MEFTKGNYPQKPRPDCGIAAMSQFIVQAIFMRSMVA